MLRQHTLHGYYIHTRFTPVMINALTQVREIAIDETLGQVGGGGGGKKPENSDYPSEQIIFARGKNTKLFLSSNSEIT